MSSNRTSASGPDAGETRIAWSIFRMTGVLRRTDKRSGKSVSTLTRAEVLGLETRLRALFRTMARIRAFEDAAETASQG